MTADRLEPRRERRDAQDRDPLGRPHADRQARRRPGQRRRHRARRHRDPRLRSSAPTSPPTRSSTSSWARCSRPGRARSPRARPRSRAASPRRSPRRRSTRFARRASARPACSTTRSASATSRSASAGGMESMSKSPYLLKEARFGFRMGDGKAIDAMINDGLTNPFSGKHMAQEASEVAAELELTRAGPRSLGAPLPPARGQGDRRGPPARGDRAGDDQGQEGRHGRRDRRGASARYDPRDARQAARRSS